MATTEAMIKAFLDYGALGAAMLLMAWTLWLHRDFNNKLLDILERITVANTLLASKVDSLGTTVARLADVVHDKLS